MPEHHRVYISAAASDGAFAQTLASDLAAYGLEATYIPISLTQVKLNADQQAAITSSPWFLVVQSTAAASSPLVRAELAEATRLLASGRHGIIALMFASDALPLPPGAPVRIQVVDAVAQDYAAALQQTAAIVLAGVAPAPAIVPPTHNGPHTVTPQPPAVARVAPQGAQPPPRRAQPYPVQGAPAARGGTSRRQFLIGAAIIGAGLVTAGSLALVRGLHLGEGPGTTPGGDRHTPGTLAAQLVGHGDKVNGVAWSPDGTRIVTAGADGTARVWPSSGGGSLLTYTGHSAALTSVAWSRDAQRIASASDDTTVRLWSATDGTTALTFTGHGTGVAAARWSPDGTHIASCDEAGLLAWATTNGAQSASFTNPGNGFSDCAWSPDGQAIAASSFDKMVKLWSSTGGALRTNYGNHADRVFSVAWSPNGQFLASAGQGGRVHVWRPDGTEVFVYTAHHNGVEWLAWSPDSRYLASGGGDDGGYGDTVVRVWEATSGTTSAVYTGHARYINGLAWSPDGTRVVSASDDGTAHIWWVR